MYLVDKILRGNKHHFKIGGESREPSFITTHQKVLHNEAKTISLFKIFSYSYKSVPFKKPLQWKCQCCFLFSMFPCCQRLEFITSHRSIQDSSFIQRQQRESWNESWKDFVNRLRDADQIPGVSPLLRCKSRTKRLKPL